MQNLAVEAQELSKSYGRAPVLDAISFAVPAGTVFALLGPNGAGKTTLVRVLATLTPPGSGHARVAGFDICQQAHEVRRRISLTGQYAALDEVQTGRENLEMIGYLRHLSRRQRVQRAQELLDRFELSYAAGRRVGTYSGGMRRRLDLAASLVVRPEVVFLDEPSTGLDLPSRQQMWAAVEDLARAGSTVFLTTQYLEEADRLAHRVAVLAGGTLVAEGTPAELKRGLSTRRLVLTMADQDAFGQVRTRLSGRAAAMDATAGTATVELRAEGDAAQARDLLDDIDPTRDLVAHFATVEASLDEVFMALTGQRSSLPRNEVSHV